jgi:hypothetical protein
MLWLSELKMPDWLSILQITVAETYVMALRIKDA